MEGQNQGKDDFNGKPLECKLCGRKFLLLNSFMKHTAEHKTGKLQCPMCKRTFVQPNQVRSHIANVHGPKKYQCEHCDKKFSAKNNYNLQNTFGQHS